MIACLNLANAQLGRALTRRRESAVRTALGAAKWRLVWNALAENLLLAGIGGAAGIALASAGLKLLLRDVLARFCIRQLLDVALGDEPAPIEQPHQGRV